MSPAVLLRLRHSASTAAVLASVVAGVVLSLGPGIGVAAPDPTPVTDQCPYRVSPPPAVDTSEVVAPGVVTPSPLPVPASPVGGARLATCGVISAPPAGPIPPRLTSSGWLVADMDSGAVIAAKDPHGRYRPASTIKVLLALVVLDQLDLGAPLIPSVEDWSQEGDSCGMGPGGRYSVGQVLTGLLVVSGNDCAHALARALGGVKQTLDKMNARAAGLGARDTRAMSPSGLDTAGMSTSPYDLALIFRAAMADPRFREIIALPTYRFPGYPPRSDVASDTPHPAYLMQTSNHLMLQGYPGSLGGKTGYTDDALKTFVGAAHQRGRTIVIVQMYGLSTTDNNYWTQAQSLLDYGFRSPADASVGQLVVPSTQLVVPSTQGRHPGPHRPEPGVTRSQSDSRGSTSTTVVVVLSAAIAVGALLLAAARMARPRR